MITRVALPSVRFPGSFLPGQLSVIPASTPGAPAFQCHAPVSRSRSRGRHGAVHPGDFLWQEQLAGYALAQLGSMIIPWHAKPAPLLTIPPDPAHPGFGLRA